MKSSKVEHNSPLGQDVYEAVDSLFDFFQKENISPKVGLNAIILIMIGRFHTWDTSKEEFLKSMEEAWDHYGK